jgi:hypothetical protein
MGTYSFLQLAAETERTFEFLGVKGFRVDEIELVQPSSFRGGFVPRLVGPGTIALQLLGAAARGHTKRACQPIMCLTERHTQI